MPDMAQMRVTTGKSTTMLIILGVLIGPFACAPRVALPPNTVRRIAVLLPCDATGSPLGWRGTSRRVKAVQLHGELVRGSGERGRRSGADARSLRITRAATPRMR